MTSCPNVVHLAATPLVGAPLKIVTALNHFTEYRAISIVAGDYPGQLAGLFVGDSIVLSDKPYVADTVTALLKRADIVHVHNDIPEDVRGMVRTHARPDCKYIYQAHSPLREGPLFIDRSTSIGFDFSALLCLPHLQQRFFPRHRMVPNLVLAKPSLELLDEGPVRIVFSPAHRRTGLRWSDKMSDGLMDTLQGLERMGTAEIVSVTGVAPIVLMELRRTAHITIDEVTTGGFHQVSLEGLAAGNVVVNGADFFARESLKMVLGTRDEVPFHRASNDDVGQTLPLLVSDRDRIRELQKASHDFFLRHLMPSKLVSRFTAIYEEVLDAP